MVKLNCSCDTKWDMSNFILLGHFMRLLAQVWSNPERKLLMLEPDVYARILDLHHTTAGALLPSKSIEKLWRPAFGTVCSWYKVVCYRSSWVLNVMTVIKQWMIHRLHKDFLSKICFIAVSSRQQQLRGWCVVRVEQSFGNKWQHQSSYQMALSCLSCLKDFNFFSFNLLEANMLTDEQTVWKVFSLEVLITIYRGSSKAKKINISFLNQNT